MGPEKSFVRIDIANKFRRWPQKQTGLRIGKLFQSRALIVALLAVCLFQRSPSLNAQEATTWKDATGREVEADFVRLTDDGVVLRLKSNGREVETKLSSLSLESHLQAIKLGKPEEWTKPLPKAYVPPKRLEPTNEVDADSLLESPFTGDETIDQFIDKIKSENNQGNYFVVWHCLPPKMQKDVAKLASKGMSKVGSTPLKQIANLLGDVSTILNEKEEFVFNNPNIAGNPMIEGPLRQQWPLMREFMMDLSEDGFWDEDNFTEENIPGWLARFATVFGKHHDAIDAASGGMSSQALDSMFTIVSQSASSAKLKIEIPAQPGVPPVPTQEVTARKLGKIWIVEKWMKELRKGVDEGLKEIDNVPDLGPQISGGMIFVSPFVVPLKNAKTQEEFDAAVERIVSTVGGLISSQLPGMGGPGGPGGGGSGAGGMTPSF